MCVNCIIQGEGSGVGRSFCVCVKSLTSHHSGSRERRMPKEGKPGGERWEGGRAVHRPFLSSFLALFFLLQPPAAENAHAMSFSVCSQKCLSAVSPVSCPHTHAINATHKGIQGHHVVCSTAMFPTMPQHHPQCHMHVTHTQYT